MNHRILSPPFVGVCLVGLATEILGAEPMPSVEKRTVRVIEVRSADAPPAPAAPPAPGGWITWMMGEEVTGPVTFLGVQTSKVKAALGAQLVLSRGIGLVVNMVVPGGPVDGVLEKHNVLVKFDDQWHTSGEQLGVLVQAKSPGDTGVLTYRRAGQQATATVTLGQREPRTAQMRDWMPALVERLESMLEGLSRMLQREEIERVMEALRRADGPREMTVDMRREVKEEYETAVVAAAAVEVEAQAGERSVARIMNLGNVHIHFEDEAGTIELCVVEGRRVAEITDVAGTVLHHGPLGKAEEQAALPAVVRARLQQLENLPGVQLAPEGKLPRGELHFVPRMEKIGCEGPVVPVAPMAPMEPGGAAGGVVGVVRAGER